MSERERVEHNEPRGYDVQRSPLSPPGAPPVSVPTAEETRRPTDGDTSMVESIWVFAVLGLLTLALLLFVGLMVTLRLTVL